MGCFTSPAAFEHADAYLPPAHFAWLALYQDKTPTIATDLTVSVLPTFSIDVLLFASWKVSAAAMTWFPIAYAAVSLLLGVLLSLEVKRLLAAVSSGPASRKVRRRA